MTKMKLQMRNNADARRLTDLDGLDARHNGGKVVYVECDAGDLDEVKERLDASHAVASYEEVA